MKGKPTVTLADVIRLDARLATWCPRCQRPGRYLDPKELAERHGDVTRLNVIARRLWIMVGPKLPEAGCGRMSSDK
jgi:hypothetical protein